MKFLITVKLPKNPKHNPHNKQTGPCPITASATCTDVTGEHHTVLWEAESLSDAMSHWNVLYHVTRIESI